MHQATYEKYTAILRKELIPATGCTEPIALAYAAALGRRLLGCLPERVDAAICGSIIKNVKSVVVPGTGGLKGIEAAIAAGLTVGDPDRELEVLSSMKRIILVRHGETEQHEEPMFIGQYDVPLSDEGRKQAQALGEELAALIKNG